MIKVQDQCPRCAGVGRLLYGDTSTWRKGIGGASMTPDLCDLCWGSGDKWRPFTSLRELAADEADRINRHAAEMVRRLTGANLGAHSKVFRDLADYAEKQARKRSTDVFEEAIYTWFAKAARRNAP